MGTTAGTHSAFQQQIFVCALRFIAERYRPELGNPADWLIRSQHNRTLTDEEKLWDKVHVSIMLGHISFVLPGRSGQKAREVKQELRSQRITLPGRAGGVRGGCPAA